MRGCFLDRMTLVVSFDPGRGGPVKQPPGSRPYQNPASEKLRGIFRGIPPYRKQDTVIDAIQNRWLLNGKGG